MGHIETAKEILTDPKGFFSKMPTTGGYSEPLKFYAINAAIYGLLIGIVATFLGGISTVSIGGTGIGAIITFALTTVVGGSIMVFVFSALVLLSMKIVGGKGSYEETARVLLYASAALLLSWIPYVGALVGLYQLYMILVGMVKVHNVSMGRAAIGVLLPLIVLIVLAVLVALALAGTITSIFGGAGLAG